MNGAAVPMNLAPFTWGRQAAIDEAKTRAAAGLSGTASVIAMPARAPSLEALLSDRSERLAEGALDELSGIAAFERCLDECPGFCLV